MLNCVCFSGETTPRSWYYKSGASRTGERNRRVSTHLLYQQGNQGVTFYLHLVIALKIGSHSTSTTVITSTTVRQYTETNSRNEWVQDPFLRHGAWCVRFISICI